jgi:wyosine [tRNA(Phe)-imidazoG37] synthetase (radical SAM superfamily)
LFLKGLNDSDKEIEGIIGAIERISPDRIQINTVVRPPSERYAVALDRKRLEEIRDQMGGKAEVVAFTRLGREPKEQQDLAVKVTGMAERRPIRVCDVAESLGLDTKEAGIVVQDLIQQGRLRLQEHDGDSYYIVTKEQNVRTE